jgi:hypothetical protein
MKQTLVRYKEIRDKILALELEIGLLEKDVIKIDADLLRLEAVEKELEYNIDFLKNEAKIVMGTEFRRSVSQIAEIRKNIAKYTSLRSRIVNELQQKIETHDFYFKEYEIAHNRLESEQVILSFDKRKKDKNECEGQGQSEEENPE